MKWEVWMTPDFRYWSPDLYKMHPHWWSCILFLFKATLSQNHGAGWIYVFPSSETLTAKCYRVSDLWYIQLIPRIIMEKIIIFCFWIERCIFCRTRWHILAFKYRPASYFGSNIFQSFLNYKCDGKCIFYRFHKCSQGRTYRKDNESSGPLTCMGSLQGPGRGPKWIFIFVPNFYSKFGIRFLKEGPQNFITFRPQKTDLPLNNVVTFDEIKWIEYVTGS